MSEVPPELPEHLRAPSPPWVGVLVSEDPATLSRALAALPDVAVRIIDGDRCSTKQELMSMFARALRFPSYFGYNWDAFEEGVRDLEWMPPRGAHAIVITRAERVLVDSAADYQTFIDVMRATGEYLAAPSPTRGGGIPLHVILVTLPDGLASRDWGVPQLTRARP
jgi:barstar (barnase inhibitor)